MPRYIDAIAAQREIEIVGHERFLTSGDVDEVKLFLEEQPTADVAPIVHAHWVKKIHEWDLGDPPCDYTDFTCSNCKIREQNKTAFCPDCGAKMDEEVKYDEV